MTWLDNLTKEFNNNFWEDDGLDDVSAEDIALSLIILISVLFLVLLVVALVIGG